MLDQWPESSTDVVGRTLRARLDELRDRCNALCRLQGTVSRAAAESRSDHDVSVLRARFEAYRTAASGLAARRPDSCDESRR